MDQPNNLTEINTHDAPMHDAVLCYLQTKDEVVSVASNPKPLVQIGFTGIVIPGGLAVDLEPFRQIGLKTFFEGEIETGMNLSTFSDGISSSAIDIWTGIESGPPTTFGVELSIEDKQCEAILLLQLSVIPVPVVPVSEALLYAASHREQRELLRSAVFWRNRFEISRHTPVLVHAGEDGLLIYTVDSWLVSINQNSEEASIDLGSHGSMWLMLGTHRDVHLHGSMLVLPPNSGAVVANELAR